MQTCGNSPAGDKVKYTMIAATKEQTQLADTWHVAPQIGTRCTFRDTTGSLYLCQIDAIQGDKVWSFGENADSFNGWFYQRIDRLETCAAPSWLEFSRAVDWNWIAQMREDQLVPEQDEEFVRNEYSKVWLR